MKNSFQYDAGYSVYPGTYVPYMKDEEVAAFEKQPNKSHLTCPAINVTELPNSYKVQMNIPGVKREEFFVHADKNVISVCIIHKEKQDDFETFLKQGKSGYERIDSSIELPSNADAEFISAEYKDGTLCMYAPKSNSPNHNPHATIVVY